MSSTQFNLGRSVEIGNLKKSIDEKMSILPLEPRLQLVSPESGHITEDMNVERILYSYPSLPQSVLKRKAVDITQIQWEV